MTRQVLTASLRLGLRKGWAEPAFTFGGLIIFLALIVSYGQLLKALPDSAMARMHLNHAQVIWYLVFTEATIMSTSVRFREVQDDIRSGVMEILLLRPVAFWPMKLAGWMGEQIVRLVAIVPVGLAAGLLLTGEIPMRAAFVLLLPSYVMALLMILCSYMMIGCTALWLGESRPVFFLYQKLIFLFGGLLWPLAFYPGWLETAAWFTPFSAMIAVPGTFALGASAGDLAQHIAVQLGWLALLLALCVQTERAMRRRLLAKGG